MSGRMDSGGNLLFSEKISTISEEEQLEAHCLYPGSGEFALYTVIGHITKGGTELPVLHCARGSTSL